MKMTVNNEIKSTKEETVDVHIEFDPSIELEEKVAALTVTFLDFVREFTNMAKEQK